MSKDSQRLEPMISGAVQTLERVFQPGEHDEQELIVARLASSVLATWAKLKQSERAQEAVYFTMARELAKDSDQLADYVRRTMPDVPLSKELNKLPTPKKARSG